MESQNKSMPSTQFCPLCAKKGKTTKILPLPINLSVGVNMCISVKCTYPFGEHIITGLPLPSNQDLSSIIQEVSEENNGVTDEDIISSVENRLQNIDDNISFPDIDDSFILQQLNQHLDSDIYEYPNTNHLVDNETLACETDCLLANTVEETSISTDFDQLTQKTFDQKTTIAVNMPKKRKAIQDMDAEISDFPNTYHLIDNDTLACDTYHLGDTVEETRISTDFDQLTQKTYDQKTTITVNMPKKKKAIQDIHAEISGFPNTNHLVDDEILACDTSHLLANTKEEISISTEFDQLKQKPLYRKNAIPEYMRNKRKAVVLKPPNNAFQGNGEPDFLNEITVQYMGNVSNLVGFIKPLLETPLERGNIKPLIGGNTEQNKLKNIVQEEDVTPNNLTIVKPMEKFAKLTEEVVEPPEKVVESIARDTQSITEIVQPIENIAQPVTEIFQPMENVVQPVAEVVRPMEKVSQPFSIVVQQVKKVVEPTEKVVEPTEKAVQSTKRVVLTKAKAAQLEGKSIKSIGKVIQSKGKQVEISKKNKKSPNKSNHDTSVEESDSDLEIVEIPKKMPNKNKKFESNLKLLSLSRRHAVLKRSSPREPPMPTRFL